MREFQIRLASVQDVRDFVALATTRAFTVLVGNDRHQVNGKSFMEMFCLDFSSPLTVTVQCGEDAFQAFALEAERFLVR